MILVGVGVAAIDHDVGNLADLRQGRLAGRDAFPVVVGPCAAAAQNDVGMSVAGGADHRHL